MTSFKDRWQITKNWQLIHPFLGIVSLLFSAYVIYKGIFGNPLEGNTAKIVFGVFGILILSFLLLKITLWLFSKLEKRWAVNYRWELIAIFLVFAITGSTSARISNPVMELLGLSAENMNSGLFWTLRILLIFPLYQILLVMVGWLFGQYTFFWAFEKKMLKRIGFKRFIKD